MDEKWKSSKIVQCPVEFISCFEDEKVQIQLHKFVTMEFVVMTSLNRKLEKNVSWSALTDSKQSDTISTASTDWN